MADLGFNINDFRRIDESPGMYVFGMLQQKYTFDGTEITDGSGDIFIFAQKGSGNTIWYKCFPNNYAIWQIKDIEWKQVADSLVALNGNSEFCNPVQTPNGRIWLGVWDYIEVGVSSQFKLSYFDGSTWQNWTRVNNTTQTSTLRVGLLVDSTNLILSYSTFGTPYTIYYKTVAQSIAIGNIQSTTDTELWTFDAFTSHQPIRLLKTSAGTYLIVYQKISDTSPFTASVMLRRASTFAGLTTASEITITANNVVAGSAVDHLNITFASTDSLLIVAYNKTGLSTMAYKTSNDDGVTWSAEVVISTNMGENNIIYADLTDRLYYLTNYVVDQSEPYISRVPRIAVRVERGCPLCGSLHWQGLVPDPKHPSSRPLHPGPQAKGTPLKNDDPVGQGPYFYQCAHCGFILDPAKTVAGGGMGNVIGYTTEGV